MMELKQVKNITQMLNSDDVENHVVGLEVLEQQRDRRNNSIQIALCFKLGNASQENWERHASDSYNHMKRVFSSKPTFSDMYRGIIKHKLSIEQLQMFLTVFGEHLTTQSKDAGYNLIEGITMDVKLKEQLKPITDEN